MWRSVNLVWTEVSEENIASIFRVEKSAREEPEWAGGCSLHPLPFSPHQVCTVTIVSTVHPLDRPTTEAVLTEINTIW
jgi:hypothetical protein